MHCSIDNLKMVVSGGSLDPMQQQSDRPSHPPSEGCPKNPFDARSTASERHPVDGAGLPSDAGGARIREDRNG
jgi:hypothetical protein